MLCYFLHEINVFNQGPILVLLKKHSSTDTEVSTTNPWLEETKSKWWIRYLLKTKLPLKTNNSSIHSTKVWKESLEYQNLDNPIPWTRKACVAICWKEFANEKVCVSSPMLSRTFKCVPTTTQPQEDLPVRTKDVAWDTQNYALSSLNTVAILDTDVCYFTQRKRQNQ